jgi:predicted DNA-binding transcriptional regulator AlpA
MSDLVPILSEFLTTEELATELGRNKRTLDRWDALGAGPPRTRVGRKVLYRRSSVQKWLAAQEQSPAKNADSVRQLDVKTPSN